MEQNYYSKCICRIQNLSPNHLPALFYLDIYIEFDKLFGEMTRCSANNDRAGEAALKMQIEKFIKAKELKYGTKG